MTYPALFFGVIALMAASGVVLRVPSQQLHWCVPAWILSLFISHAGAWLSLQTKNAATPYYFKLFTLGLTASLVFAVIVTGRLVAFFPFPVFAMIAISALLCAATWVACVGTRLIALYPQGVPDVTVMLTVQAAILFACGFCAFFTTLQDKPPAYNVVAWAFCGYCLLTGAFYFFFSIGIAGAASFGRWKTLNNFIPAMIVIVAFSWLALRLSTLQHEGSRELVPTSAPATAHPGMEHV